MYKFLIILRILWICIVSFLFYLDLPRFLRSCFVFWRWIWNSQFTLICKKKKLHRLLPTSLYIYSIMNLAIELMRSLQWLFHNTFCPLFTNKTGKSLEIFTKFSISWNWKKKCPDEKLCISIWEALEEISGFLSSLKSRHSFPSPHC